MNAPLQQPGDEIVRLQRRIDELAAANEELVQELAALRRALPEVRLGKNEIANFLESFPGMVVTMHPNGDVEYLNRSVLEYFGRTREELIAWALGDAVHPDDLARVIAARAESISAGEPYDIEHRCRRADGVYRWFHVTGLATRAADGTITGWFLLLTDIDDRKRAENAARASESDLKLIIDTIPALAWSARPDGTADFFNQHYLDYIGLSAEQAADWGWTNAIHPDDLQSLSDSWQAIMASGMPGRSEARLRGVDGEYRRFLFRANPLRDQDGRLVKWYGINTDIEDPKKSEALLAGEKQLLEMVAGAKPLPSILEALCRLVEETASGFMCGVLLLNAKGTGVELSVGPSLPPGYNESILGWPVDRDAGPCARAVTIKEPVIVNDIASDLRFETHGWRSLAMSYGLRGCWSTPILSSESAVLGTFALYTRETGRPASNLHNIIGQMTHLAAVAIERKSALEKLQANQDLLDLAQKSAGAMAFDWYIQEDHNDWSPEQEALFGLAPGGFDGSYKAWKEMMYAPDWPVVVAAIQHAHQTGKVAAEYRVVWPDGSLHWLATSGRMFFDEDGKPLRMVGFTSDVTQRKLIEEELRRSEAFLAEGQRLSLTGSFSWRPHTDAMTFSDQSRRIFGFEPNGEVTLKLIGSRIHPEDLPVTSERIGNAREVLVDQDFESRLLMPDGSVKHIHTIAHAIHHEDGGLEYIGAIQDITDRLGSEAALSELRSQLAHVSRVSSLGAMTASIAHEVNQPLSGIITNANTCMRLLNADPPNIEGARETVRRTIRDGNRASEVIKRLRALFSKKDFSLEAVDLNEAAQEVITLSRSELHRSQVVVRTELAPELPLVAGDRVQLQQVILNLILNAADAMSTLRHNTRQLTVVTDAEGSDLVRLSVRDVGSGFTHEAAEKLFDAFYTTKETGMGIGLSVSRSIIERHRGRLWAAPNDGPGAVFSFSIPTQQIDDPAAAGSDKNNFFTRNK